MAKPEGKLARLRRALSSKKLKEIGTVALLRAEGEMKRRIFNEGRASDNSLIGKYKSKSHKQARVSRGRQVARVDLQNEGNLIKDFRAGKSGSGNPALGFLSKKQRLIAEGNTNYRGKQIFQPSKEEVEMIRKILVQQARKYIIENYK